MTAAKHTLAEKAEAMVVAAEQCAWWIASGVQIKVAARVLGVALNKRCISWRDLQPYVAARWLEMQKRLPQSMEAAE